MSFIKEIPDLVKADVISQEVADKITDYYNRKGVSSGNRLLTTFGSLGGILIGLGLILIIAHNWDEFSRPVKLTFAFLPLITGQIIGGFALFKRSGSVTWRESTAAFLFFAIGACISLVSQIYNIPGNLEGFLLLWMILCLPLVYLINSSVSSLLYVAGITAYACFSGYSSFLSHEPLIYWVLLLAIFPHYYLLYRRRPESNQLNWHHWVVPLSIIIALGTIAKDTGILMFIAYFSLFGLFYQVGRTPFFKRFGFSDNGYLNLGSLGTIILLLSLSFDEFWQDLRMLDLDREQLLASPEFYASAFLSLLAAGLFFFQSKSRQFKRTQPIEPVFILFILFFIIGSTSPFVIVLVNVLILIIGVLIIREGARSNHLGILNYGLLIIGALVLCRFFDANIHFVIRGILFISVGIGFFFINYRMLKKRKTNG